MHGLRAVHYERTPDGQDSAIVNSLLCWGEQEEQWFGRQATRYPSSAPPSCVPLDKTPHLPALKNKTLAHMTFTVLRFFNTRL